MKTSRPKRTIGTIGAPAMANSGATPKPLPATGGSEKALAPIETLTEVKAKVDVGWGNTLFIRGQGDGLSWEKGKPLLCADSSTWVWSTRRAGTSVVFRLLLNDQIWAAGTDAVVQPGQHLEIVPTFK
jgi:hypothetical protein